MRSNPVTIMITSPIEEVFVDRISQTFGDLVELLYDPALLPIPRYQGDHTTPATFQRSDVDQHRWRQMLARAEVLWDLPMHEGEQSAVWSPHLKWLQTTSAGVGMTIARFDLAERDVIVTTASGLHAGPLAEWVFAALLYHTKMIPKLEQWQDQHHWERYSGGELRGQTLAIIGPGRIGREVSRLGRAFGMQVLAMASQGGEERAAELGVDRLYQRPDLHLMLAEADVVVLSCPHTPDTEAMIGRAEIAAMRDGVVLVNIARGSVVDESAMIAALQSGKIGFAALDVFQTEPLPVDSPLWDLPNVLVNPHSASTVQLENDRLTDRFIANLHHYLAGNFADMVPRLDINRRY